MRVRAGAVVGVLVWVSGCFSGNRDVAESFEQSREPGIEIGPPIAGGSVTPPSIAPGFAGGAAPFPTDVSPVVRSEVPPVAIQGGTLLVARDGTTAIAADPDRDRVVFADLVNAGLLGQVELPAGSEPGRLVEDAGGRVHVVLRRTGEIAAIDVAERTLLRRTAACAVPQGLAYDAGLDALHVACTGGELVTLAAADGSTLRSVQLDPDLRDVVVRGDTLFVSRFKTAELLTVDASGAVVARRAPKNLVGPFQSPVTLEPVPADAEPKTFAPAVAWRLLARPDGALTMLHQRGQVEPIDLGDEDCLECPSDPMGDPSAPDPGAAGAAGSIAMDPFGTGGASYGGGLDCNGIVETSITHFDDEGETSAPLLGAVTLAVDAAVSPNGSYLALAVAGNATTSTGAMFFPTPEMGTIVMPTDPGSLNPECVVPGFDASVLSVLPSGQSIGVAFDGQGRLVVQTRDPNRLRIYEGSTFAQCFGCESALDISLGGDPRRDTGHDIFHTNAGAGLACASCHPGGLDDGRAWSFAGMGVRRTQLFNMGIEDTLPLHWDGSLATLDDLVSEVFVRRMGGVPQSPERTAALGDWIETLSPLPPLRAANDAAAERGRALFESAEVGCATCHAGAKLTNNSTQDVGTGGSFQVPSLVGVYYHQPYLHTGCATTLRDRFDDPECGGGDLHGKTSQLSAAEIDDLVAYLESL